MKIIKNRERVEVIQYSHNFEWSDGGGFSFPCNEKGEIDLHSMTSAAKINYDMCLAGTSGSGRPITDMGVERYEHSYPSHAVGLCGCGEEVYLTGFTNTCDGCNADYNMSGQLLADRSQWGEETNESLSDILDCDNDY